MQVNNFSIIRDHPDLSKSIWLHQNIQKFWEISFKKLTTTIRVGTLIDIETEIPDPQQVVKTHLNMEEVHQYIEKHVNTKLSRSYKFESSEDYEPPLQKKQKMINNPQIVINQPFNNDDASNEPNTIKNDNFLRINKDDFDSQSRHSSLSDFTDLSYRSRTPSPSQSRAADNSKLGSSATTPIKVLLAEKWDEALDPKGHYISEKLDGIRCFWDGSRMWSRNGNRFFCPPSITKNWPKCQLDGELWTKRSNFQKIVSIVKKHKPVEEEWQEIMYFVYDCPGLNKPFKDRYKAMEEELSNIDNDVLKVHKHILCEGHAHLQEELKKVLDKGGEGLMLRDPMSRYENKRSKTLLKVKVMHDEEATVVGHEEGTGRCQGMMGALICENHQGRFKVGSGFTDQQRKHPPKKGTKITYKFQNTSDSGKPRFPVFLRVYEGI